MHLENIVWDSADPHRLGTFWAAALGADPFTDEPGGFEARLSLGDELFLDLCFPRVDDPSDAPQRLHLDLHGGDRQAEIVERLVSLGARHADIGQGDVPWVVLADPDGNPFCVMEGRSTYRDTGPVAAIPLDSADPDRDVEFWAEITGWVRYEGVVPSLRHPSGVGPLLELCPEPAPKGGKSRLHLDVRSTAGDGDVIERVTALGARQLTEYDTGDLPWDVFADPSGNEFCILAPTR